MRSEHAQKERDDSTTDSCSILRVAKRQSRCTVVTIVTEDTALLAERHVLRDGGVHALAVLDVEVHQVCDVVSLRPFKHDPRLGHTLGGAVEEVRPVLDVLELARIERELVVRVRRGRVADEDTCDVVRELLRDPRVRR